MKPIKLEQLEKLVKRLNVEFGRPVNAWEGKAPNCKMTNAFYLDKTCAGWRLECQGSGVLSGARCSKSEMFERLWVILETTEFVTKELFSGIQKEAK